MARLLTSTRARLALSALLLVAAAIAIPLSGVLRDTDVENAVEAAGPAAPLAFLGLYVALTVLMFPGAVISAAAGALFGVVAGTALTVAGATVGAAAAFYLARRLGRERVAEISGRRARKLDGWIAGNGFLAVLYTRLVPVLPFNLLNYAYGVSAVRTRDYVLATATGIVPGSFAYVALGSSLGDPLSAPFLASVALIVVLAVAGPVLARRLPNPGARGKVASGGESGSGD